jgi:shikimate dehydrogenase
MKGFPGRLVLLGHPVSHSLSPSFQNAALEKAGIALRYEALDVAPDALAATLDLAKREGWAGNVTVPHKEAMFAACSELTPVAQRVGAVNTFMAKGGALIGHNTDVMGFQTALLGLLKGDVDSKTVVGVIGAGGAAAAVLAAMERWPRCRTLVANRDTTRRDALVARFGSIAEKSDVVTIGRDADVVVNATSLGLRDSDPLPIDVGLLRPGCAVLDLVYSPNETRLVREARARGLTADDGLAMLLGQGVHAFGWWFNAAPDADLMWRTLLQARTQAR